MLSMGLLVSVLLSTAGASDFVDVVEDADGPVHPFTYEYAIVDEEEGAPGYSPEVVGGEVAASGEWDDTVGIVFYGSYVGCTGTLIGPKLVLTAAHCLDGGESSSRSLPLMATAAIKGGDLILRSSPWRSVRRWSHAWWRRTASSMSTSSAMLKWLLSATATPTKRAVEAPLAFTWDTPLSAIRTATGRRSTASMRGVTHTSAQAEKSLRAEMGSMHATATRVDRSIS